MPWLLREEEVSKPEEALLLVHIPRTGGTKLYDLYNTAVKARKGHWPLSWIVLLWFSYRHMLHESTNFPVITIENFWFVFIMLPLGISVATLVGLSYGLWTICWAAFGIFWFTFFATPPGFRNDCIRRILLFCMGIAFAYSYEYLYCGDAFPDAYKHGSLLIHLTAPEMVKRGLVSKEQMQRVSSFSFVRNPYRRMISLWLYNRFGVLESFPTFVHRWHAHHLMLREKGEWDMPRYGGDWSTYCHRLPCHVFTHGDSGERLVRYVIRLEDMQLLQGDAGKMPETLEKMLEQMAAVGKEKAMNECAAACAASGRNARPLGSMPWQKHYTPELAIMVHEMFAKDFEIFGYDPATPVPPEPEPVKMEGSKPSESSPLLKEPLLDNSTAAGKVKNGAPDP